MKELKLSNFFRTYSEIDVASALFIISSWNPNRSSELKIKYSYQYFLSLDNFSKKNRIHGYNDFEKFYLGLMSFLPSFPSLEDYIPENDWGEIKYFFRERFYRVLYGCDLSWPYDFLASFEIIATSMDQVIFDNYNLSPLDSLENMLNLSNYVIGGLEEAQDSSSKRIDPGHMEFPSQDFFEKAFLFLSEFTVLDLNPDFVKKFNMNVGKVSKKYRNEAYFQKIMFDGNSINFYFVECSGKMLPTPPRWYVSTLLDRFSKVLSKCKANDNDDLPINLKIGMNISRFVSERIDAKSMQFMASASYANKHPEGFIFPFTFISKDTLYLFSCLPPYLDNNSLTNGFDEVSKGISKAKEIFLEKVILGLNLEQKHIAFHNEKKELKFKFIVILPHSSTAVKTIEIPENLDAEVMFLEQFLGLIDELESVDSFDEYLDFKRSYRKGRNFFTGDLDTFAAFKDSDKVLIAGANQPDFISIDPHWGTDFRFRSLVSFWHLYPQSNYLGSPRSWDVSFETPSRTRLSARSHRGFALSFQISNSTLFITSPFEDMEYELASFSNLIAECLEDYLSELSFVLKENEFFKYWSDVRILVFPKTLIQNNSQSFSHLNLLASKALPYAIDSGKISDRSFMFRFVFDDTVLHEKLSVAENKVGEIEIIKIFLDELERKLPNALIRKTINDFLNVETEKKPGYTVEMKYKKASFPDFVDVGKPSPTHYKLAKKFIANLAKENELEEGKYNLKESKVKIDKILRAIEKEINKRTSQFNMESSIPFLIEKIDALTHESERKGLNYSSALQREIRYDLAEAMKSEHEEYISMHISYRYMIEKMIHISPMGQEMSSEDFKNIIALIEWYFVFINAGDQIHHSLYPVSLVIDSDFRVDVINAESDNKSNDFIKYSMSRRARINIRTEDQVSSGRDVDNYLKEVDDVFYQSLNFKFVDVISILQVLATWGYREGNIEGEKTYYKSTIVEMINMFKENIPNIDELSISLIIDFLVLKKENMCKVIGRDDYPDLPVWEYFKRHSRYNIKPIIKINNVFYWGPYSALKSGVIWTGAIQEGRLPTDLDDKRIHKCLLGEKKLVEKELEKKSYEIIKRFTTQIQSNVFLHKKNKEKVFPLDLGDYDVLAYLEDKNIVINLECKHLHQVHSLKDARDLKEELFGRQDIQGSYVGKVLKRHDFLKENLRVVFENMGWQYREDIEIKSIFCTKQPYFCTHSPPLETPIIFLVIDELHNHLESF